MKKKAIRIEGVSSPDHNNMWVEVSEGEVSSLWRLSILDTDGIPQASVLLDTEGWEDLTGLRYETGFIPKMPEGKQDADAKRREVVDKKD